MISVEEAKQIITENTGLLAPKEVLLQQALALVLAEDVLASMDIPAFRQSSMDGYAFSFSGWQLHKKLLIKGEVAAGSPDIVAFAKDQAVRIFTGAAVPGGADTVVMQEKVNILDGRLYIEDEKLLAGSNVRPVGSEIKSGATALTKGSILSPAAIGFLAGIGITHVQVYPNATVSIIVTGKELQQSGTPLTYGQVYESNSSTITAALEQFNIKEVKLLWADDDLHILKQVLQTALEQSDVVLLTGGISVGDYDFVLEAATQCGVTKLFHGIRQRPGKPLYFGKKPGKLVFGLPGNPSSVLTCFYEYVLPALMQVSNKTYSLRILKVPLGKALKKPAGLTHFIKGWYDGEKAFALDAQESYRLSSFAKANCLIQINENIVDREEGELVEIHLLPG